MRLLDDRDKRERLICLLGFCLFAGVVVSGGYRPYVIGSFLVLIAFSLWARVYYRDQYVSHWSSRLLKHVKFHWFDLPRKGD